MPGSAVVVKKLKFYPDQDHHETAVSNLNAIFRSALVMASTTKSVKLDLRVGTLLVKTKKNSFADKKVFEFTPS